MTHAQVSSEADFAEILDAICHHAALFHVKLTVKIRHQCKEAARNHGSSLCIVKTSLPIVLVSATLRRGDKHLTLLEALDPVPLPCQYSVSIRQVEERPGYTRMRDKMFRQRQRISTTALN